jgi:UPF0755 protein
VRFLVFAIALLLLAAAFTGGFVWYSIEKPFGFIPPEGKFVDVPRGASQRSVSHLLERNGIIRSAFAFEIYARRHPKRSLQAGEYFFDHPATGKEVFWKLANGDVYQQPFTVKEGETIFDIARDLQDAKYMKAEEFLKVARDATQILDIAPNAKTLEGFLFPATYNLPRNATAAELTTMMVRKFREALLEIAPDRANTTTPPVDLLQIVTLASLVERETPRPQERPLIAGVFTNRMQKAMLLQCDPTVIYALDEVGKYKGTLTLKDLKYDSPYNTYLFAGLPPGPIGNPSGESLKAAFHPAQTDYLYFVANTQGGHFFAATLAEHNQNVLKYHQLLKHELAEQPSAETGASQPALPATKGKR